MRRTTIAVGLALGGALLGAPGQAGAVWGEAQLVSVHEQRLEQADGASGAVDVSGDGRWVVFQTRATNFFADDDADAPGTMRRGGVFRFDRLTGAIELVADGDLVGEEDGALRLRGATAPSVSDDGRRVAFATAQRLAPQDDNDNVDVYVRDMTVPLSSDRAASGAYRLVSARDGSDVPASYAPRDVPLPGRNPGADVTANVAISADGNRVAFRTVEQASDLPASAAVDTPPGQVFVRDIAARRTVLMSAARTDGSPAGGAVGPTALSADGSTVVWVGTNAAAQTRLLNGERTDDIYRYYLWRKVDGTTTRRITGQADPDDPACDPSFEIQYIPTLTGPCYGPLTSQEEDLSNISTAVPAVSRDGNRVAFLTSAGLRPTAINMTGLDVFLTDMSPGVTRKAGTVELTRDPFGGDLRSSGAVQGVAMSGDGQHLAIATTRTRFVLPSYAQVGTVRSTPDTTELYVVDLDLKTIDRVVRSAGGGDTNGDAGVAPTLSEDGSLVAFTSSASNLFYGDANARTDAFVAAKVVPRTPSSDPPPDANQPTPTFDFGDDGDDDPELDLELTRRKKDGGLTATLVAPAAGTVKAAASTSSSSRAATAAATKKVTLASASRTVTKKGKVTLTLAPGSKAKSLLKRSKRIALTVRVVFTPKSGGSTVADTQTGSFVRAAKATKKKATKKTSKAKKK
jgi:Tol biopolymer transport system component